MRFLNPKQEIRVSAGREVHLRSLQPLALYPANSVFVSGYLTEPGQAYQDTWKMIEDMGFEIEEHREGAPVCEPALA
jgi:biotin synthase